MIDENSWISNEQDWGLCSDDWPSVISHGSGCGFSEELYD